MSVHQPRTTRNLSKLVDGAALTFAFYLHDTCFPRSSKMFARPPLGPHRRVCGARIGRFWMRR